MVKQGHFEVLRKKSSTMTDIVWAEESKNGLRFETRPSYDGAPKTSPCQAEKNRNVLGMNWLYACKMQICLHIAIIRETSNVC